MKVLSTNRIVNSLAYPIILEEYNKELKENGKINKKEFFFRVVAPKIPSYSLPAWYQFCKKFESSVGLVSATIASKAASGRAISNGDEMSSELQITMMSNEVATQKGIQSALNAGSMFYEELQRKYSAGEDLTKFEEGCIKDAMFKAMKSQDSRIHAIGKIKQDSRAEEAMDRAFNDAMYNG